MDFSSKIPGTFGEVDLKFAFHEANAERAIELLKICYQENITMEKLLSKVEDYLREHSAPEEHIKNQVSEVSAKFSGWLPRNSDLA